MIDLKRSLATKLTVMISIVFVLAYCMASWAVYHFVSHQLVASVQRETMLRSELASRDIQRIFENAKIVTEQLAMNREIVKYLESTTNRDAILKNPLYPSVKMALADVRRSSETHFLVSVANTSANFYLDSEGNVPDEEYNVYSRPWYPIVSRANEATFTQPYIEWRTKKLVISSLKAVKNDHQQVVGYVIIDIMLDTLPMILQDLDIGTNGNDYLVSENGVYIYHKDQSLISRESIYDLNNPMNRYASAIMNQKKGFQEVMFEGKPYYLTHYPATEDGWVLFSLMDRKKVLENVFLFTVMLMGLLLIPLIPMVVFVKKTVQKLITPVEAIARYSDDLVSNRVTHKLPTAYAEREDEMGVLARSFKAITEFYENEHDVLEAHIQAKNNELENQYRYILETEKMASLGSMVAGVAHEINTPLGISVSTASFLNQSNSHYRSCLQQGKMTKEDLQKFMEEMDSGLEILQQNLERGSRLIQSFKKVAVNQSAEMCQNYDLKEMLEVIKISLKHELKLKNVYLAVDCPMGYAVVGDPGDLAQVLTNLILNSLQHGFKDRLTGQIDIKVRLVEQFYELIYTDNGVGLDSEQRARLFEPFYTTNRQEGNSGLGMHIVYNLINQRMKGTIICQESKANSGVHFVVRMPKERQEL